MSDPYYGLPVRTIENDTLRVDYLAEAGPRLVRLFLSGNDENLLGEVPEKTWDTPYGKYSLRGGHRLWHSPEAFPRSYFPDDGGVQVDAIDRGVRLVQPVETPTGIRKSIEVQLADQGPRLVITHTLKNEGVWPVELAPWAITVFPLGGVAVLPDRLEPSREGELPPDRRMVLWPYQNWKDQRLQLDNRFLLIHARAQLPPVKVGYPNRSGWIGYYRKGVFICKCFDPQLDQPHSDFGCNAESYCNDAFIELETLGVFTKLEPGASVTHTERWEIFPNLDFPPTFEGIEKLVSTLRL
ncbi:MAG: hypothetical protein M1281_08355 [Chloroflexi bacterium]|nr:hypothetical protein [Chloroflexota bacterium]